MNFKALVERVIGEHGDIYTVEEISTEYNKWEVSGIKMKSIQRLLRQKGYYEMGIKGLVPDVEPRNEIEKRAKELVDDNISNFEFWKAHAGLHHWINRNLTKERLAEICQEYDTTDRNVVENTALKVFTYGLIIFSPEIYKKENEKEIKKQLSEDLKSLRVGTHFALDFNKDVKRWKVTQFRVYKEYNLDKETEQQWGNIASAL